MGRYATNKLWRGKVSLTWIAGELGVSVMTVQRWKKRRKKPFPSRNPDKALALARSELQGVLDKSENKKPVNAKTNVPADETLTVTLPGPLAARLRWEAEAGEMSIGEVINLHLDGVPLMFESEGEDLL